MFAANDTAEALAKALATAAGWRLTVTSSARLSMGMDDGELGGAYSPPRKVQEVSGSVFIVWEDGTVSKGLVSGSTIEQLKTKMSMWRSAAYRDDDAAHIAPLAEPAPVGLSDPRVAKVVQQSPRLAFDTLTAIASTARKAGADNVDASVACAAGNTVTATSTGLWVSYAHTSLSCGWVLNKSFAMWRLGRALETWKGLEPMVASTGEMLAASRNRVELAGGRVRVIFWPAVVDQLVQHYLVHNLSGDMVVEKRSRFSLDQFAAGHAAFRNDLSLELDTTIPMAPGSYPCTDEGIPGSKVVLVDGGRLVTPLLNTKYARKSGLAPTALPAAGLSPGYAGFRLRLGEPLAYGAMLSSADEALLVTGVLGMHTQDPVSGNFSLAASDALLVKEGRLVGAAKVVISGNFFDILGDSDTAAAVHPAYETPALAGVCRVEA